MANLIPVNAGPITLFQSHMTTAPTARNTVIQIWK